jgi:hypothetical protein
LDSWWEFLAGRLSTETDARMHCRDSYRQLQHDARAIGLLVRKNDFAPAFLRDTVANAQSESGTFAHGLGSEARVERAVWVGESRA